MPDTWYYEVNGFELGPVPTAEIRRLLAKGRVVADTPLRASAGGHWSRVDHVAPPEPAPAAAPVSAVEPASAADPWAVVLLERWSAPGIPLGVALWLLPWREASAAGAVLLTPFAVAAALVLAGTWRAVMSEPKAS